jgi:hypothetical protein
MLKMLKSGNKRKQGLSEIASFTKTALDSKFAHACADFPATLPLANITTLSTPILLVPPILSNLHNRNHVPNQPIEKHTDERHAQRQT